MGPFLAGGIGGFFHLGTVARRTRNATIQHGAVTPGPSAPYFASILVSLASARPALTVSQVGSMGEMRWGETGDPRG